MEQRLCIIHAVGNDSVGLVGKITTPIAEAGGNIVDLRQDVLHGLFTIYLVVDLTRADLTIEKLRDLSGDIARDTGLSVSVDKFSHEPRSAEITYMLLVLLGSDKPGIIATVTKLLSSYNINIEFSDMIARENVFLMDLMVDISKSSIPLENLKEQLRETMDGIGIASMFQSKNVFNKKHKVILFDISSSFMKGETIKEITRLAKIDNGDVLLLYSSGDIRTTLESAAEGLDGLPVEVINSIMDSIEISADTLELIQTLKIMGYKIGLISSAFTFFTNALQKKLDIDFAYGYDLIVDNDSKTVSGDIDAESYIRVEQTRIIEKLVASEKVLREDIAIISDRDMDDIPGIALRFDIKCILDYLNQHILSKESLLGLLGSFGIPKL